MKVDESQEQADKKAIEVTKSDMLSIVIENILTQVGAKGLALEKVKEVVDTSIISKSKDKGLSGTKTWCSNILIKLFFLLKSQSLLPESL